MESEWWLHWILRRALVSSFKVGAEVAMLPRPAMNTVDRIHKVEKFRLYEKKKKKKMKNEWFNFWGKIVRKAARRYWAYVLRFFQKKYIHDKPSDPAENFFWFVRFVMYAEIKMKSPRKYESSAERMCPAISFLYLLIFPGDHSIFKNPHDLRQKNSDFRLDSKQRRPIRLG